MKKLILLFLFLGSTILISAQPSANLRKAFILGENEEQYDAMRVEYARTLLIVNDNDPEKALTTWFKLLKDIEAYAEKIGYSLNGVKLYMNVFWNTDGTIDHIGILPMNDSKNIKHENLVAIFASFIRQHTPEDLGSDKKYSHYTTVNFPTFAVKGE